MPKWLPMRRLGDTLSQSLARLGLEGRIKQYALFKVWPTVVGPQLASQSQPQGFIRGKLVVHVSNSLWLHQMTMMRPRLLTALRAAIAPGELREIVLRIGAVDRASRVPPTGPEGPQMEQPMTPEQTAEMDRHLAELGDAPFRTALRTLWMHSLQSPSPPRRKPE